MRATYRSCHASLQPSREYPSQEGDAVIGSIAKGIKRDSVRDSAGLLVAKFGPGRAPDLQEAA